ncbi:tail fiber protein [Pseudomonas phage M3.1]|uniref:Tail fiber protein n=1 Tax=Pseudomonas phage AH05 TaxID=2869574 RepID=A0AAE8BQR2_9CAUD|nr:tail fiber protein [Pseudomonas phage AH05]UAV89497.1 tail fiber protein [Pseudomonas phage M1.1]UAV89595.1 tail fiber protein [Pseudomonas phage M3.1]
MATTPKTVRTFTLDGAKKDFTIPFEYLARKFVVVTLIGATRRELILNTEYRFSTATTITTTKAWGPADNFDLIEIRRLTSATERLVDFADGSILRAYDLNISQVQSLHIAEEARDLTADTIGVNNDGDLDARARKIVNLADGVNDGDAVNLRQQKQWAGSALNQANAAAASAQQAATNNQQSLVNNQQSYQNLVAAQQQAANSQTSANNSANSASASQTSRLASETARDLSQAWASKAEDQVVSGGLYSSYHYSRKSAASAAASQTSATNSASSASFATTEANRATTQADRAKTEADKLGNMNLLGGALDSVVGNTVTWKGRQVSKTGGFQANLGDDAEANFSLCAADGTDPIRLVRVASRDVHLFGNASGDGSRMIWSPTGVSVPKTLTVNGQTTLKSTLVSSLTSYGVVMSKGGMVKVQAVNASANAHVWFYAPDGSSRGILYCQQTGQMTVQAGGSVAANFFPDGRSAFNQINTSSIDNQGRVASYRSGIGVNASMYANCHYMAQTDDGSPPAYGFHRGGSYALAMYLSGTGIFLMDSGGSNREVLTNANLMAWIGGNMTADVIGSIATMYNQSGTNLGLNSVLAGGSLRFSSHNNVSGKAGSGSWRSTSNANNGGVSTWVRYA